MRIFRLYKEERLPALVALGVFVMLNALAIYKYYRLFMFDVRGGYWTLFYNNYHVSGFDSLTYLTLSKWGLLYARYRHPLLSLIMYPPYMLNTWIIDTFGFNAAQYIIAVLSVACAVYSFIFMYRIMHRVIGLQHSDSLLLSTMLFGFAYVMLASMVPDHFIFSMFLLLLTLYMTGMKMQSGAAFRWWQTALLFFITSGVTVTNGIKTFIATFFTAPRRFFSYKFFLPAVVLPCFILLGISYLEYDTTVIYDPPVVQNASKTTVNVPKDTVRHLSNGTIGEYTNVSTPRISAAVENLFGESMQLHQRHLLEDVLRGRPEIVRYSHAFNYIIEALVMLLFVIGAWCGRRLVDELVHFSYP
jgi:hypothetical protein